MGIEDAIRRGADAEVNFQAQQKEVAIRKAREEREQHLANEPRRRLAVELGPYLARFLESAAERQAVLFSDRNFRVLGWMLSNWTYPPERSIRLVLGTDGCFYCVDKGGWIFPWEVGKIYQHHQVVELPHGGIGRSRPTYTCDLIYVMLQLEEGIPESLGRLCTRMGIEMWT